MNISILIVQQHLADDGRIAVVGYNIYNHTVVIAFQDSFSILEKFLYEIFFSETFVHAIVLNQMAAPRFAPAEQRITQIFVPLQALFDKSF